MPATYRLCTPEELQTAIDLWVKVFEVPAEDFEALLDFEETRQHHQSHAAFDEEGNMVSSVHVFVRPIRDGQGGVQMMGGIGSVATLESARKQGHSGKLLEQAKKQMTEQGLPWSLLFTGVNHHYARYGWQNLSLKRRSGDIADATYEPKGVAEWLTAPYTDSLLDALAPVYDTYNNKRAFTLVRNNRAWHICVRYRLEAYNLSILTLRPEAGQPICAYAVVRFVEDKIHLAEVCAKQGWLEPVYEEIHREAQRRGVKQASAEIPSEPESIDAFQKLVPDFTTEERTYAMALSISPDWPHERIQKAFDEGGISWSLDNF